jgi:heme oxygenase (biliverdin-IX-beta and delta-forming)
MNKLRTALRERTEEAHRRLDGLFSDLNISRRADYARFLAAQAGVLEAVEKGLDEADAPAVIPDWAARRRSDAMRLDLAALAELPSPVAFEVDWIRDRASILGTAYVLEGSRLGGKMMLREALSSAEPEVTGATRFLGHGEGQRMWPSFDALLGATELSDTEIDGMVESAVRTFELFESSARLSLGARAEPAAT